MLRVVVDTNVWVSALLNPRGLPARVASVSVLSRIILVNSQPLLDELHDVLSRPRILRKYALVPGDIAEFTDLIRRRAEMVVTSGAIRLCRDPRDDVVIETALAGHASLLVSRDDDLKGDADLVRHLTERGATVLSVQRFLDLIDTG
jgi:uncharacterized protein